jgi:hypothetical protein
MRGQVTGLSEHVQDVDVACRRRACVWLRCR